MDHRTDALANDCRIVELEAENAELRAIVDELAQAHERDRECISAARGILDLAVG